MTKSKNNAFVALAIVVILITGAALYLRATAESASRLHGPNTEFARIIPVFSRFDSGIVLGLDTGGTLWLLEDSQNMYMSRLLADGGPYRLPIKIMDNVASFTASCRSRGTTDNSSYNIDRPVSPPLSITPNIRIFMITNDKELWAIGHNLDGMLGDGTTYPRSIPVRIMENVKSVYEGPASTNRVFALTVEGDVYGWQLSSGWEDSSGRRERVYFPATPAHIFANVYSLHIRYNRTWVITNDRGLYRASWNYDNFYHIFANVKEFCCSNAIIILTLDGYLYMRASELTSPSHRPNMPRAHTRVMDNMASIQITRMSPAGKIMAIDRDGRLWRNIGFERTSARRINPILSEPEMILENVETVKSARGSFFAITTNGKLYAWGDNGGALGTGTSLTQNYPVRIMEQVVSVYPFRRGYAHPTHIWTFAITENRELYGWGQSWTNNRNEFDTRYSPVHLMDSVVSIHSGYNARILFLRTDGRIWELQAGGCYKIDCAYIFHDTPFNALLRASSALPPPGPVPLAPPITAKLPPGVNIGVRSPLSLSEGGGGVRGEDFSSISAAITGEGRLFWLSRTPIGNSMDDIPPIEPILALENVISVATGREHLLAITEDNRLFAWGHNFWGVIGDNSIPVADSRFSRRPGRRTAYYYPVNIMNNVAYVHVSIQAPFFVSQYGLLQYNSQVTHARGDTSFAITLDGDLFAWGGNNYGQVGDGSRGNRRSYPFLVMGNVAYITTGSAGSVFAITNTGDLYTWGNNTTGGLQRTPIRIMENIASVSASGTHTLAVTTCGDLWAWGTNENGQLGNNSTQNESAPIFVKSDVISATAGLRASFAITRDGTLWGFGASEMVNSTARPAQLYPRPIMEDVAFVSATYTHTAAITNDGNLWRLGFTHQWGTPNFFFGEPVWIMSNVVYLATAARHSVAVTADGSLWRWRESSLRGAVSPVKVHDNIMLP